MRWIACLAFLTVLSAVTSAQETTYTFQNEALIAGVPYYGVTDYTKQHYPAGPVQWKPSELRWYAYGPAALGDVYQFRRLVTVFDIGALPRGMVEKAILTYTIHYDKDVDKSYACKVFSTAAPYLEDGDALASGQIPPGKAGQDVPVTFDVTEYVKKCKASASFELRSAHDRYLVSVWTSGKWGPWARAVDQPVGSKDFFPKLTVSVIAPRVPPSPTPCWVAPGEKANFGGDKKAVCSFVSKPRESSLKDSDIRDGSFVPDVSGDYVVQVQSNGIFQYAAVTARPVHASRPRLSIDSEALARLGKAAARADGGWIKLKRSAEDRVVKPVERGYAGFGYREAVDTLSMAYLVSDDERYARRALEVMETASKDGLPLVSSDSGYCIRAYGPAIAIGYDRLNHLLSNVEKARYWRDLNYWLAWYAALGYQNSGPAMGNYFSGYFSALYTAAYATYGENPRAPVLMDEARRFFDDMIVANVDGGPLEGGDDPEGRYAGLYFETWFNYLLTRRACGDAGVMKGLSWPREVALSYIHRTRADEKTFYDYGAWRDQEPSWVTPAPMVDLSWLLAGTKEGEYAQCYAAKYTDALFSPVFDPARKSLFWSGEPKSYFSRGLGLATARSSWEKDACWVSFQGGGVIFCDHQHRDFGHFEIYRGADALLVDANTDDGGEGTEFHNCLLVAADKSANSYTPGQRGGKLHCVTSFEDVDSCVLMTSDLLPNYASSNPAEPLLKNYHRTHAYVWPGIVVVIDSFETARSEWPAYGRLNFAGTPQISGSSVTASNGASALRVDFFGDPVVIEKVEGQKLLEKSVNYRPAEPAGPKTIVAVYSAAAAAATPPKVSASVADGKVTVGIDGGITVVLNADGSPGGSIVLNGKSRSLAPTVMR